MILDHGINTFVKRIQLIIKFSFFLITCKNVMNIFSNSFVHRCLYIYSLNFCNQVEKLILIPTIFHIYLPFSQVSKPLVNSFVSVLVFVSFFSFFFLSSFVSIFRKLDASLTFAAFFCKCSGWIFDRSKLNKIVENVRLSFIVLFITPADIYLFKVNNRNTRNVLIYVES